MIEWDINGILWDFIGIQWDINGIYPLVKFNVAIENDHRNSGFSH